MATLKGKMKAADKKEVGAEKKEVKKDEKFIKKDKTNKGMRGS